MKAGTPLCYYKSFERRNKILLCAGDIISNALNNGYFEADYEVCHDYECGKVIFKPLENNSMSVSHTLDLQELEEEHGDNMYIKKRNGVKYDKH